MARVKDDVLGDKNKMLLRAKIWLRDRNQEGEGGRQQQKQKNKYTIEDTIRCTQKGIQNRIMVFILFKVFFPNEENNVCEYF
jgi:hypothetical protein